MSQINAARQFLSACEAIYRGDLSPLQDIPSRLNTVETYAQPDNQKKYVHMYFAKYVGCWRAIRKRIDADEPHRLVSVGAGPMLCCIGWHWDAPSIIDGTTVRAYDILDWNGIRNLPEFEELWNQLFNGSPNYLAPRYMPDGIRPPQTLMMSNARSISVSQIGSAKIVLLPSILNHLVGGSEPVTATEQSHVFDWIEKVRAAGNTVVIADMLHRGDTERFWRRVTSGLRAPRGSDDHNLDFAAESRDTAQAYSPSQQNRRAGLKPDAMKAGVLCGTPEEGWSWIT